MYGADTHHAHRPTDINVRLPQWRTGYSRWSPHIGAVFVCARSSASRTRTPTGSSSARADSASRSRSRLENHAPCLPAALCPPRLPRAQCQIYEADSEVVTGEMRDFSTLVPRLLEQLQRERDGQPLTSRRLVVFVFNGHNHYDATVPQ